MPSIGRLWALGATFAITAVVTVLPAFHGTAQAAINLNLWAAESKFTLPGGPFTQTTAPMNNTGQCSVASPCTLQVNGTSTFPATCPPTTTCQLLISDGLWGDGDKNGAEILTYNSKTATSFNVIQRGPNKVPGSAKVAHPIGSKVKLDDHADERHRRRRRGADDDD